MRGPAPTPTPILKLRGSWVAKTRTNEPAAAPIAKAPCPKHLKGEARKIWQETSAFLLELGVLSAGDLPLLADYCLAREEYLFLHAFVRTKRAQLREALSFPVAMAMRNHARDAMNRMGAQLGLSPASRTRLNTEQAAPPADDKARFFRNRS